MIELNPERHDELAALIAEHMEQGGETLEAARWSARAAHWAGHSRPQDALRLWGQVTELAAELEEDEETAALGGLLAAAAARLRLAAGDGEGAGRRAGRGGERDRRPDRRPALAGAAALLESARPGLDRARERMDSRPPRKRSRSPTNPATSPCGSRSAPPAPTPTCAPATSSARATARRDARARPATTTARAGIVIGCPLAWALMGKGMVRRERGELDAGERADRRGAADRGRAGRPRDRELDPRQPRLLLADAGRHRGGAGARPAQLRADRAPRRRFLAHAGRWSPLGSCGSSAVTRRAPWRPSSGPTASTARRWAGGRGRGLARGDDRRGARRCGPGARGAREGGAGGHDRSRAGLAVGPAASASNARPGEGGGRRTRLGRAFGRGREGGDGRRPVV